MQGDVREIVFLLVPDPTASGGQMLVRRVYTNLLAQAIVTPPDQPICHNVQSIAFSYFDGVTWTDTWDSTQLSNTLPIGVQITLTLAPTVAGGVATGRSAGAFVVRRGQHDGHNGAGRWL